MTNGKDGLKSAERRNFLKLASTGSFTAALVAGAGGVLWSSEAAAQTAKEEKEREKECLKTINDGSVDGAILLSKNKLTSLCNKQYTQLPIQYIQLSEKLLDRQLKEKCITTFSRLLSKLN